MPGDATAARGRRHRLWRHRRCWRRRRLHRRWGWRLRRWHRRLGGDDWLWRHHWLRGCDCGFGRHRFRCRLAGRRLAGCRLLCRGLADSGLLCRRLAGCGLLGRGLTGAGLLGAGFLGRRPTRLADSTPDLARGLADSARGLPCCLTWTCLLTRCALLPTRFSSHGFAPILLCCRTRPLKRTRVLARITPPLGPGLPSQMASQSFFVIIR